MVIFYIWSMSRKSLLLMCTQKELFKKKNCICNFSVDWQSISHYHSFCVLNIIVKYNSRIEILIIKTIFCLKFVSCYLT